MADKVIVCGCEDVSTTDIARAISLGHRDIESVKRYTGLGTGPCQGKSCLAGAMKLCALAGLPKSGQVPFRARPPLQPTALAHYAGLPLEAVEQPGQTGASAAAPSGSVAKDGQRNFAPGLKSREPLPDRVDTVIIGGGIIGLSLAWNLMKRGAKSVLVLERGYLCAGASGRNGGGVRAQWTTPTLIELAKESIAFMGDFAQELGINVWLRKGGYLFLAHDAETVTRIEQGAALHRRHGLPTKILSPDEAAQIVPELDRTRFVAASWNPDDGVVFPWPFVWGYADGARKLGARIEPFTRVTGLDVEAGRVTAVRTDRGVVKADRVVIASGAWSPEVAALAGVLLPNRPYRHEIVSSEPLKPFLGPLVSMLGTGLYFSQSMRGEIVGGMGDHDEPAAANQESSLRFLARYSKALTEAMPIVGQVKLLRQWAGLYDVTPDGSPVVGETPGVAGLLQVSGFVGYGFMMAPAVGRRMAEWMGGAKDDFFTRFALSRFAEGRSERETMHIG